MDNTNVKKEIAIIKNRKAFTMNGVLNILEFDAGYVALETAEGRVCVGGDGLKVEALQKSDGEISVIGNIRYVEFDSEAKRSRKHK